MAMRDKNSRWLPSSYRHYTVGFLRRREIGQIARLEALAFPEPLTVWAIIRKFLSPRSVYIVVRDEATIAAYFGFEVWGHYAHVIGNVTHPDYRRQGLAGFVLTAAEPLAKALGAKGFLGEVRRSNTAQLQVLEAIGWESLTLVPRFFGNGEDAYLVWRGFNQEGFAQ